MALNGNLTGSAQYFNDVDFYAGIATTSLRFDDGSSPSLSKTPDASNRKTHTLSMWIKRCELGANNSLFRANGSGDTGHIDIWFDANDKLEVAGASTYFRITNRRFRDVGSWYHIVFAFDTTDSTANNRLKIYVNGVQETSFATNNAIGEDADTGINANIVHSIGTGYAHFDGYMAEINFIDGTQLTPTSFGETKNGVWIPKDTSGLTFGTEGYRLQMKQSGVGSASTSTIGADTSGNDNHYTSSGIVASDCAMPDSPENNFTTLNSLMKYGESNRVISEGNLKFTDGASNSHYARIGANLPFEGKWYWEVLISGNISSYFFANGTCDIVNNKNIVSQTTSSGELTGPHVIVEDGKYYDNGSLTASYGGFSSGDILQVYFDADIGSLFMGRNNTAFNSGSAIATSLPAQEIHCAMANSGSFSLYNFGQDSSFAGNKTAQGNTDGNGIGDFYYAPPSGFLALCTANLPEPTIGPNSGVNNQSDDHFNTVLWTGNATDDTAIAVDFQPDWTWIKKRSGAQEHVLFDSNRGATKRLFSNLTNAESAEATSLKAFTSSGFTLGTHSSVNDNTETFVGWNWKANGGTTSTNEDGSIDSTVQANTTSGFSIVTYTGTGSNATIGHGLSVAPEFIVPKNRDATGNWYVYTGDGTKSLLLNGTQAQFSTSDKWNNTAAASSVFSIGTEANLNGDGNKHVAYCFHSVDGYSKIGKYTGNGNADGTVVFTGFRPAWVLFKRTDGAGNGWGIKDTVRDSINPNNGYHFAESNAAEGTATSLDIDFLSNGFKFRGTSSDGNGNGNTYIYMAFAEAPFKYANAR